MADNDIQGSPGLAWRTLKNSIYGVLEYAWPIVIALVASPYIVNTLGADQYGVLAIVGVTMGFLGFLDLGIGAAATHQIAAFHEAGEPERVSEVVNSSLGFYALVGVVGAAVIAVLAPTLATSVLAVPPTLQPATTMALWIAAAAFPVTMVMSAFGAVPRALQRYDITTKMSLVFTTLGPLSTAAVLAAGGGLVAAAGVGAILTLTSLPVYVLIARRLLPGLRLSLRPNTEVLRGLIGFGGYFLLSQLAVLLLYQLDKILIGSLIGVAAVTYYVVPGNLAQRIQGLVAAAVGILFPVSAGLFTKGDREPLVRLYRESTRIVQIMIVMVAVPMAMFAHAFLNAWMGPGIAENSWAVMVVLVGTYALLASTGPAWTMANGAGRPKINAVFTLGLAVLNIGLFFVLVPLYGVFGAALSYIVAAAVGVPPLIFTVERRLLGLSGWNALAVSWRVWLAAFGQLVLAYLLTQVAGGLVVTLTLMAISSVSFLLIYYLLGFAQPGDLRIVSMLAARLRLNGVREP